MYWFKCVFRCCIAMSFIGIIIGTLSFFPLHQSSRETETISSSSFQNSSRAQDRRYDRFVWIVIDALRADMVYGPEIFNSKNDDPLNHYMPYTSTLLQRKAAQAYVGFASLPTGWFMCLPFDKTNVSTYLSDNASIKSSDYRSFAQIH